jgi:hypothetical protein
MTLAYFAAIGFVLLMILLTLGDRKSRKHDAVRSAELRRQQLQANVAQYNARALSHLRIEVR